MSDFRLESPAFENGAMIPTEHTGEGDNTSPALRWFDVPESTEEFVLICDDPDAPVNTPWVHWLLYKIPKETRELPAGIPNEGIVENLSGARQGTNSFKQLGYGGPYPPAGDLPHRYYFILYALDAQLTLPPGATREELLEAMRGNVIAEVEIMGKFRRQLRRSA